MVEIKDLSSFFKTPLNKLFDCLTNEVKQIFSNRLLEYQVEEYKRNYYSKTILHRTEPKALNEFYQPLYIKQEGKYTSQRISTKSVKQLLDKWNYITIIGNAGSGKSTIVKYLYTNCFTEGYKIPIKIELRYLNEYSGSICDYIFKEIFRFQKLGISDTIVDRMLGGDNFIFFFDGYDELNSIIKSKTTKDIDSFVEKYSNNKYIITSRPFTNIDLQPLFVNFYVCDLDDNEVADFVRKQIAFGENELAEKIIKAINKDENRSYRSFLSNPLLLSMFILTFQSYSEIPQKRSEFYDQVFDTLFSIHDSVSKLAYVREKLSGLAKDEFEDVLQLFSFLSFFEEKFIFSRNYLTDKLDFIKSKKKNLKFDNDKFIEDLQIAIGILNKEGLEYTFPHRSLQEYFAALYISKLSQDNKISLYSKLKKNILDDFTLLMSKDHFYGLLGEMDYNNLSTMLSIPIMEEILICLRKKNRITKQIAYEYYGKLMLLCIILLKTRLMHKKIHAKILDDEIKFFLIGGKGNFFSLPPERWRDRMNFDLLKEKIKEFKTSGDRIIKLLKNDIAKNEKSDSEIIKLI